MEFGLRTGLASEDFNVFFHLAHWPASVNIQFRGTVLGSETILGAEENSADVLVLAKISSFEL